MATYRVVRTGRTWAVVDANGTEVEGGFFDRTVALDCAEKWTADARRGQ